MYWINYHVVVHVPLVLLTSLFLVYTVSYYWMNHSSLVHDPLALLGLYFLINTTSYRWINYPVVVHSPLVLLGSYFLAQIYHSVIVNFDHSSVIHILASSTRLLFPNDPNINPIILPTCSWCVS